MATTVKFPIPTEKITDFCQRWQIVEFSLFGSILTDHFGEKSDVDVLVSFAPETRYTLGDLDLMEEELEIIFDRSVDLLEKRAVQESQNYIRRREILGAAQVIYQATHA